MQRRDSLRPKTVLTSRATRLQENGAPTRKISCRVTSGHRTKNATFAPPLFFTSIQDCWEQKRYFCCNRLGFNYPQLSSSSSNTRPIPSALCGRCRVTGGLCTHYCPFQMNLPHHPPTPYDTERSPHLDMRHPFSRVRKCAQLLLCSDHFTAETANPETRYSQFIHIRQPPNLRISP